METFNRPSSRRACRRASAPPVGASVVAQHAAGLGHAAGPHRFLHRSIHAWNVEDPWPNVVAALRESYAFS